MLDIGLDFGFLKGRIPRHDRLLRFEELRLLSSQGAALYFGLQPGVTNIGDTRNRGWEVSLSTVPVETKDFHLGVNLSYYRNKEELIRLQDPKMKEDINNGLFVGYPVNGVHYNYKQVGIWQENEADLAAIYGQKPGEVKVADLDGNGKIDGQRPARSSARHAPTGSAACRSMRSGRTSTSRSTYTASSARWPTTAAARANGRTSSDAGTPTRSTTGHPKNLPTDIHARSKDSRSNTSTPRATTRTAT